MADSRTETMRKFTSEIASSLTEPLVTDILWEELGYGRFALVLIPNAEPGLWWVVRTPEGDRHPSCEELGFFDFQEFKKRVLQAIERSK